MTKQRFFFYLLLAGSLSEAIHPLAKADPFVVTAIGDTSPGGLKIDSIQLLGFGLNVVNTMLTLGTGGQASNGQAATFKNFSTGQLANSSFNLGQGLILSTGYAAALADAYSGGISSNLGLTGNSQLNAICNCSTRDAVSYSIAFNSGNITQLSFKYAFASSEYPTDGATQNDVAGIFLANATQPNSSPTNLAVLPNNSAAVSVETIPSGSPYFAGLSSTGTPFAYGGISTLLNAQATLQQNTDYILTFSIANAEDDFLDSALLVQYNSDAVPPPSAVPEPSSWLLLCAGLLFLVSRRIPSLRMPSPRR